MARNKYPEQTVELILETARRLFLEKGYEATTIQDIVDGLGGAVCGTAGCGGAPGDTAHALRRRAGGQVRQE